MRKILIPVISLVSLILLGIAFGLGSLTAATNAAGNSIGQYYTMVWYPVNALGVVGFFFLCFGTFGVLLFLIPFKFRKVGFLVVAALLIAAGILSLLLPSSVTGKDVTYFLEGGLIALAVLEFISGACMLVNGVLALTEKSE